MNAIDIELIIIFTLFFVISVHSLFGRDNFSNKRGLIKIETSSFLKALCCIVIVCHHYSLRTDGGLIRRLFAMGGGTYSLVIFLLLSSYGIAMSDKFHPLTLKLYLRKRIWNLFKPYSLITLFFIAIYFFIGANAKSEDLATNRISLAFVELGQHQANFFDIVYYMVGIKTFDAAMWFVGVTMFFYIAFGMAKYLSSLFKQREVISEKKHIFWTYTISLLIFAIVTYEMHFPAHYYRNLWALDLGLWLALYGTRLSKNAAEKNILMFFILNILLYIWLRVTKSGDLTYMFFANIALFSVWMANKLFCRYSFKPKNTISFLAGISYFVYLIHVKVLTLEWWYWGYRSLLLPLSIIILLSYVFSKLSSKI